MDAFDTQMLPIRTKRAGQNPPQQFASPRIAVRNLFQQVETKHDAAGEIDRVERLVSSAERLDEAKRAIATPVVKAMAFGTGVSRAAQRLREGEPPPARRRRRRRAS